MIIDISPMVVNRTGVYHLVRETVRYLRENGCEFTLYAIGEKLNSKEFYDAGYSISSIDTARLLAKLIAKIDSAEPLNYRFWEQPITEGGCFVFDPLYLMFLPNYRRTACVVHDLTPVTRPAWHGTNVGLRYRQNYELLYRKDIKIISVSESTKRDLWANFGIEGERVDVVGLYDRFNSNRRAPAFSSKAFLFVGSLELRKNVIGLIEAFEQTNLAEQGYVLNIVGGDAMGSTEIKRRAATTQGVHILGKVDDHILNELYESCLALAYPSYWEGFGMPALEAANRGIPMILSDCGALPEIVGPFAIYVDPVDICSIANGIKQMASLNEHNPEKIGKMIDDAHSFALKYSKERYMGEILRVVNRYCM